MIVEPENRDTKRAALHLPLGIQRLEGQVSSQGFLSCLLRGRGLNIAIYGGKPLKLRTPHFS